MEDNLRSTCLTECLIWLWWDYNCEMKTINIDKQKSEFFHFYDKTGVDLTVWGSGVGSFPPSPVPAQAGLRAARQYEDPSEAAGSPGAAGRNQKLLI